MYPSNEIKNPLCSGIRSKFITGAYIMSSHTSIVTCGTSYTINKNVAARETICSLCMSVCLSVVIFLSVIAFSGYNF